MLPLPACHGRLQPVCRSAHHEASTFSNVTVRPGSRQIWRSSWQEGALRNRHLCHGSQEGHMAVLLWAGSHSYEMGPEA